MDEVRGVIPLESTGQRTTFEVGDLRIPGLQKLIGRADRDLLAPVVLQSRPEAKRLIQRHGGRAGKPRHRGTVVGEAGGEQPRRANPMLGSNGAMPGVMKMGVRRATLRSGVGTHRHIDIAELLPVLPAEIPHHRPAVREGMVPAEHDGWGGRLAYLDLFVQEARQSRTDIRQFGLIFVRKIDRLSEKVALKVAISSWSCMPGSTVIH